MAGSSSQTINAYPVAIFFYHVRDQVCIADRYAPDKTSGAKEPTGGTGFGIDQVCPVLQLSPFFITLLGKIYKGTTARVSIVTSSLSQISLLVLIPPKWIADYARLQTTDDLFTMATEDTLQRASRQKY